MPHASEQLKTSLNDGGGTAETACHGGLGRQTSQRWNRKPRDHALNAISPAGVLPIPAAIASAVEDALTPFDIRIRPFPDPAARSVGTDCGGADTSCWAMTASAIKKGAYLRRPVPAICSLLAYCWSKGTPSSTTPRSHTHAKRI